MAKDLFHDAVRRGLEKEQWIITDDPLELEWEEVAVKIDLGAERLIAAERDQEKIAVEIKSFIGTSAINDFHTALGQFLNYRIMLGQRTRSPALSSCTLGNLSNLLSESLCSGGDRATSTPPACL